MIEFASKNGHSNVILFIHGLKGSYESWNNFENSAFHELLNNEQKIKGNFDIAYFEYHTTLLNSITELGNALSKIKGMFKKSLGSMSKKNINISEIAENLLSDIRFQLEDYENIVIIAHSMGGIIAKQCILKDIQRNYCTKIKLLLSLAVPHLGSNLANFGDLISKNFQVSDLKPLSSATSALNSQWLKCDNKPEIKYFYGTYDVIVPKNSAISIEATEQDIIACQHDHTSICKPIGANDLVIKATLKFLMEFIDSETLNKQMALKQLNNEFDYDDEYFVLKLVLADIHHSTITNAKEMFLNAECARKLYTTDKNLEKMTELYAKIRTIYKEVYDKYLAEGLSEMQLVTKVHEYISSQDKNYLDVDLPKLDNVHKKGMIHQLANELSDDIWWKDKSQTSDNINILLSMKKT